MEDLIDFFSLEVKPKIRVDKVASNSSLEEEPIDQMEEKTKVKANTISPHSILEDEVNKLKTAMDHQLKLFSHYSPKGLMKPRDIPKLTLAHMHGLEATATLQIFFEQVEQTSQCDEERVQIAKGRLSSDLAVLIHNAQGKRVCLTWHDLKFILRTEFPETISLDQAWEQLDSLQYDWIESPRAFTNKFMCQYASLETRFPHDQFPSRDRTIKRKILRGMPFEAKERLEVFIEDSYPLSRFLDRVEHERMLLEARNKTIAKTPILSVASNRPPSGKDECPSSGLIEASHDEELRKLKEQVALLAQQLGQKQEKKTSKPYNKYCAFCRAPGHDLRECQNNPPPPGVCFDCKRQGCRRGGVNCPGKVEQF